MRSSKARSNRHQPLAKNGAISHGGTIPTTASAVTLAIALLAGAPQAARAANECGADGAGNDSVTCSAASYPGGITYNGSNGLTLNLANPSTVIPGPQGVACKVWRYLRRAPI